MYKVSIRFTTSGVRGNGVVWSIRSNAVAGTMDQLIDFCVLIEKAHTHSLVRTSEQD